MRRAIFGLSLLSILAGGVALAPPAEAHWAWNGYRNVWVPDGCGPRCQRWHYWHRDYPPPPPGYYR
jgi:hypothetical protein